MITIEFKSLKLPSYAAYSEKRKISNQTQFYVEINDFQNTTDPLMIMDISVIEQSISI